MRWLSIDLRSYYKSIWIGPLLLTWCIPVGEPWWKVSEPALCWRPEG
jgi:hypothetical protein